MFLCSSTNNLTLTVTQPAPITMPKYIQRIGIVNRTNPIESSNILDKIDKILSVEMAGVDTQGVVQIIYGLQNELQRNSNFTHVKVLDTIYLTSKYISDFSPQIPWNTISRICKQNNVDALFVLEIYDTDTQLQYSNVPVTVKVPIVGDVTTLEHQATAVTTIKV